jgi:hypothetical protein
MNILNFDTSEYEKFDYKIKTTPNLKYDFEKAIIKIDLVNGIGSYAVPQTLTNVSITGLIFDLDPSEHISYTDVIKLYGGGNKIKSINTKLLTDCYGIHKLESDNKFIVPMNFKIYSSLTGFHQNKLKFIFSNPIIQHISLQVEKITFTYPVDILAFQQEMLTYNTIYEKIKVSSTQLNYITKSYKRITGYYITCNISNIKTISIKIADGNKTKIFSCDKINLGVKCIKISPNTIFIPLDTHVANELTKYKDKSGIPAIFKNKIVKEFFIIKIKFFIPENYVYLSKLNINLLRFMSGMCGCGYSWDDSVYIKETHLDYVLNEKKLLGTTVIMDDFLEPEHYDNLPDTLVKLELSKVKKIKLNNLPCGLKKLSVKKIPNFEPKIPFGCVYKTM